MLTRDTFTGPWAGLPVAWTDDDQFDEETYRADVARCYKAGVPGVYTGGTTGEFYAMELDEFKAVAKATVEESHAHSKPAMVGCSSTYTLGAVRRASFTAELGADAIQVALPFWMEVGDAEIVPFFTEVTEAADGLPLSIYETTRAKKTLTLDQHRAVKDAVPTYLMVKTNAGTVGATPKGCRELSEFINVFVGERLWPTLGPQGAIGCCSSMVYENPRVTLSIWQLVVKKNWAALEKSMARFRSVDKFYEELGQRGYTDTAYDRLGGAATGFLKTSSRSRGPYPSATEEDVKTLRELYREHVPEMLEL